MTNDIKKIVKIALFSIFFIFIISYGFYRSKDLLFGVKISHVNLISGQTYTESIIPVTGNAKNAVTLTLNGREISVNEQGDFNESIALLPGYNIINIRAEDKFKFVDEKNYQLIFKK
jgi:hypothetical protein